MVRGQGPGRRVNILLSHMAPWSGLAHEDRFQEFLKAVLKLGYREVILKSGWEPAKTRVLVEVDRQREAFQCLRPHLWETARPMRRGRVPRAQVRAVRQGLDMQLGIKTRSYRPFGSWVVKHSAGIQCEASGGKGDEEGAVDGGEVEGETGVWCIV